MVKRTLTYLTELSKSIKTLEVLFILMLVWRFVMVIIDNPAHNLFSDPARHWENGNILFHPSLMSSIDPKLYQLFIFIVRRITTSALQVGIICGLLSSGTAYVWYRACRELYKRESAMFLGLMIGICPSLTAIFNYIMNETLLLFMLGLSLWLTLRAIRKKTANAMVLAACIWVIGMFCRIMVMPLAIASIWFILHYSRQKLAVLKTPLILLCICCFFAGWQSYRALNVFAPFGFSKMSEFYRSADTITFEVAFDSTGVVFGSPSFYTDSLAPFSSYKTYRSHGVTRAYISSQNGVADWDREIEKQQNKKSDYERWQDFKDNIIFLAFSKSWPDSTERTKANPVHHFNYLLRWIWAPLMLLLLIKAPLTRATKPEMLILASAYGMLLILIFQHTGVMEGRYRKPLEPYLIISTYIILRDKALKTTNLLPKLTTPGSFLKEIYLKPIFKLKDWSLKAIYLRLPRR